MPQPQKITGKQVNLLMALFNRAGIRGDMHILEWIEEKCDVSVNKLEELNTGHLSQVISTLKRDYGITIS